MAATASIITRDINELSKETGNIYKTVNILGKRARQIAIQSKEELNAKLAEFASTVDNLEEIFENREQIEISRFYERMPKAPSVSLEEYLDDDIYWRKRDEEENK